MSEKKALVTFSLRKDIVENYRAYCKKEGLVMSKRIEILMEKEVWGRNESRIKKNI